MRKLLWLIAVILFLGFAWLVVFWPITSGHIKDGVRSYVDSIPISGNIDERKATYTLVWGFIPLKMEIQDLKMQGPRGEWDGKIFFEPVLSIKYVKLDPKKIMLNAKPEVLEMGQVDFKGKIAYRTLLAMLREAYPNFHGSSIEYIKGNVVRLTGVLQEVQSEVVFIGEFKVNESGELEFTVDRLANYLREEILDARAKEKVLRAFKPKWHFEIMGLDLKVDKAAVSELGIYIEAESSGRKFEMPKPVITGKPEEKNKGK